MENNEFEKVYIKNRSHHYFEDCDIHNILIDKKFHENVLVYDISYKTLWIY